MDHLQNVLSYFDQQQPLCAEHDRIPKDLYRAVSYTHLTLPTICSV